MKLTLKELRQVIRLLYAKIKNLKVISLLIYKMKEGYETTGVDFKQMIETSVQSAIDRIMTKYYYAKDAIKIVKSVDKDIKLFVNIIIEKLGRK